MATFTVGPDGKLLMDGKPIDNLWGSLGRNVTDVSTGDVGYWGNQPGAYDPRFYEQYDTGGSESSSNVGYRLRPEVQQQLGGQIQLMKPGAGGYGEAMDPSQLTWDDQFGVLTKPTNIKEPDPGNLLERNPWMLALPAAYGALSAGGAFGGGPGGGAFEGAAAGGEVGSGAGAFGGASAGGSIGGAFEGAVAGGEAGNSLLGSIGAAITKNPLMAASLGMQLGGVAGGLLGGNKPAGSGGGSGGLLGGGLNIRSAQYKPNQQTERQLQELYGGNMGQQQGQPMGGAQFGQAKPMQMQTMQQPWQNNLYGGGQNPYQMSTGGGSPFTGGQQNYPSMQPKPMQMSGGDFGPLPPPSQPPGDFGPLPPPGGLPGSAAPPPGMLAGWQSFLQSSQNRPQIADQNIDQSVRNSAIGDGFSGLRNGLLFAGGQRLMPTTGSAEQDQATLRQFGVRPQTFGSQYGF